MLQATSDMSLGSERRRVLGGEDVERRRTLPGEESTHVLLPAERRRAAFRQGVESTIVLVHRESEEYATEEQGS